MVVSNRRSIFFSDSEQKFFFGTERFFSPPPSFFAGTKLDSFSQGVFVSTWHQNETAYSRIASITHKYFIRSISESTVACPKGEINFLLVKKNIGKIPAQPKFAPDKKHRKNLGRQKTQTSIVHLLDRIVCLYFMAAVVALR